MASLSAISLETRKRKAAVVQEIEAARWAVEDCERNPDLVYGGTCFRINATDLKNY